MKTDALTLDEIKAIRAWIAGYDMLYCPKCHQKKGSSMGCHAHTMTTAFTWWHCHNCDYLYGLIVTPMAGRYLDGFGLDEPKHNKRR